jgi:hypothetical protein
MFGERSCLSLIVAGSSTNAALGGVSAGGVGTPELDVTHVVLDQPVGSAGGVTPSKSSKRSKIGSQCPSTRSLPSIACAATILVSPSAAAATRNNQKISRSGVCINLRFGFVGHYSDIPRAFQVTRTRIECSREERFVQGA